jgi:outer membrane protein TolC
MKHPVIALAIGLVTAHAGVATAPALAAETLTFAGALQRTVDTYPSLPAAEKRVARAREEIGAVESTLGWNLGASAGLSRDTSFLGLPSDRVETGANLERQLEGGGSVGVNASLAHEDASQSFSPLLPNPADTLGLDLSYRQPLARGAGNPEYQQGLASARAGVDLSRADRSALYDELARETADLFYAAALTRARIENARLSIDRAERLKRFLQDNLRLGIAEEKDMLQAEARLRTRRAELEALKVTWNQQRASLNRLMGRPWEAEFVPAVDAGAAAPLPPLPALIEQAESRDPDLARGRARVRIAEATIERSRDARQDVIDVVYSVGTRSRSGDTADGSLNDDDVVGGVRLEYSRALDRRGVDAALNQAQLDRDIALQDMEVVRRNLRYRISGLTAEIDAAHSALRSYRSSLAAENAKLDEAIERYRTGRIDTSELIQFENDLHTVELLSEQQAIDLARKHTELALLTGRLWGNINAPALQAGEATP